MTDCVVMSLFVNPAQFGLGRTPFGCAVGPDAFHHIERTQAVEQQQAEQIPGK